MHLATWLPLLFVPPAIIFIVWQVRRKDWFAARRRRAMVCLSLATALLLLAISQPTITIREEAAPTVIFVADASPSMRCGQPWTEAAAWVRRELPAETALGVVTFSDRAEVAAAPAAALPANLPAAALPANLPAAASHPATNIEQALRTAAALAVDPSSTALLLYSDGWETEGNALAGAAEARARGLRVFTLAPAKKIPPDAAVVDLRVVGRQGDEPVAVGETFRLAVTVRANCDAPGKVYLEPYRGGEPQEQKVEFKAGQDRTVEFPVRFDAAGYQMLSAVVSMAGDAVPEDDSWTLVVQAGRRKPILIVSRAGDNARERVVRPWLPAGSPMRWFMAAEMPDSAAELGHYAAVVLDDVPAWEISAEALAALAEYVHDMGGGLVALGGSNSFGLGGYTGTPLDEMLPVRSEPDDRPPVELVILLDRSASMAEAAGGAAKLDLAKEAVLQIAGVLSAKDRVTVLAFNQQFATLAAGVDKKHWEALQAALGPVRAAGGTLIGPPLEAALELLSRTPAATADGVKVRRHVIMVTDGEVVTESGATPFDAAALAARAKAAEASVSVVLTSAAGAWSGLGQLAAATGGRYYDLSRSMVSASGGNDLSRILMEDLPLAVLRRQPAPVAVGEWSPIWRGDEMIRKFSDLPEHLATEAKQRAAVNLLVREPGEKGGATREKYRPVLATWNYGLGRAAAWPAPVAGENAKWLAGPAAQEAFERSIEWAARGPVAEADYDVTLSAAGGRLTAEVRQRRLPAAVAAAPVLRLTLSGVAGGGKPLVVELRPSAPGVWKLEPTTIPAGAYAYALVAEAAAESRLVRQGTLGTGPSAEYLHLDNNVDYLERLAAAGGGEMLGSPGEARRMTMAAARASDLWPYLVALAGLLVLYDALRGLVGRGRSKK
jgi:Mg-chelatase subunit ChlD